MNVRNFTTLAWHSKLEEQAHRRSYAYGSIYPLVCGVDSLPTFQLVLAHSGLTSYRLFLVDTKGNEKDITQDFEFEAGGALVVASDFDVLMYGGGQFSDGIIPEGIYYLRYSNNEGAWYSDLFCVTSDIDNYMSIEWWDNDDFVFSDGKIIYDGGFRNKLYVKSEIGKPEYTYEEEGEERDGLFYPTVQFSTKTYRFSFLANEAVCDALRFARLSENIIIKDSFGNEHQADSFLMTPEWDEQGDIANVLVEFTSQSIVKKLGLGYFCKN